MSMRGWSAVYLRELYIIRRRVIRQLASMSVAPFLYVVAFGYGLGQDKLVDGTPYLAFLLPGLIALNTMNHAYSMAGEINISRFYFRMFEEFQSSPITNAGIVAGEVAAGVTRSLVSAVIILLFALAFGVDLRYGTTFFLAVLLNAFVFASLAVCMAMIVKTHQDQTLVTNFVVTPMAFLGGTFFPVENMPAVIQPLLKALPVTQASTAIRTACLGRPFDWTPYLLLLGMGLVLFSLACLAVDKARE